LSPILSVVAVSLRKNMDCYRDMRDVRRTFLEFMERVPFYGMIVGCNDDAVLRRLLPRVHRRVTTYGTSRGSDFVIRMGPPPVGSLPVGSLLAAGRQCGFRRVHVIFQPHRFTRTRDLMDEFTTAFAGADTLCLLDIYPASEKPIEGITAEALASRIVGAGKRSVAYVPSFSEAVATVGALAQPGDMVLTL